MSASPFPRWKHLLFGWSALIFMALAAHASESFRPDFAGEKIGRPDWLSVYTHLPGLVQIKPVPVKGQRFTRAAMVELTGTLPDSAAGKATYLRSRAISAGSNQFAVEWSENIHPDIAGPQFELWGEVGKNPNECSRLLLRLFRMAEGLAREPRSAPLVRVEPGWRRFKVVVSAQENTFDLYYEDMERAVATGLPLSETIGSTDKLGIGFVWYLTPSTPTTQWQVGGISLLPLGSSFLREQVKMLWHPPAPQARLVILESGQPSDTDALYERFASNPEAGQKVALDIVPHQVPEVTASGQRAARSARPLAEPVIEKAASDIARNLGLPPASLPAAILTTPTGEVRGVWQAPFDKNRSEEILSVMNDFFPYGARVYPSPGPAGESSPSRAPEPLKGTRHVPEQWLILGTWAGPAGLSLWGPGYESEVRPNPGEPQIVSYWDSAWHARWESRSSSAEGRVVIEKLSRDFAWSKGSAYAHLYIYSPASAEVSMDFTQTGSEINGWLNGRPLDWRRDPRSKGIEVEEISHNDQGGAVSVRRTGGGSTHTARLNLDAGWNRLLVKLIMGHRQNETFAFSARFSAGDESILSALRTTAADPAPTGIARQVASRFMPRVYTNAPFNLVYPGEPLALDVDIGSSDLLAGTVAPFLPQPSGRLELTVSDYDGREVLRKGALFSLPGRTTFDLGPAPARGYYTTLLRLYDDKGNLVHTWPPDGFSVIGGAASQRERRPEKKTAVTYYFTAVKDRYRTLCFPYMERIGVLRNIGGNNTKAPRFYREAHERGLDVSLDTWGHRDPDYVRAYVKEGSPYTSTFKALNEVDINSRLRGTPASWVAKAKQDYEIIKAANPSALMLGASLVRPASDEWFEECLKLGLADYHDVWDVHCYPKKPPVLEGTMSNSVDETELGVLKVYQKLGIRNTKPFWIGETAARSGHGHDGRRWQADTTAKMVACVLSRPDFQKVGFLVPWKYARGDDNYSIMDIGTGHMPAEAALYTASALVDGFDYERLKSGATVQLARFGQTLMAWTTDGAERELMLQPPGSPPFVQVDVVGRVRELDVKDDGRVMVSAGDSPIYVLSKESYDHLTAF